MESDVDLDRTLIRMWWVSSLIVGVLIIAWPLLALPAGVFSKGYFEFWVSPVNPRT